MALKSRPPAQPPRAGATRVSPSLHWSESAPFSSVTEDLVIEAPLAIEVAYERLGLEVSKVLGVTMRTPGEDDELVLGFLLAEGLIKGNRDVRAIEPRDTNARGEAMETRRVILRQAPREDLQRISRSLLTTSACGLCGRPGLEGLPLPRVSASRDDTAFDCAMLAKLPDLLRRHQPLFAATGGSHGAMLCDRDGGVLLAREDVGRHNAVDKLVGAALLAELPLAGRILVLSGRASFELLQKAAAASLGTVVAVGAPSSAAVALAHATGITLAGFARGRRLNVYAHAGRLNLGERDRPHTPHDSPEALSVR